MEKKCPGLWAAMGSTQELSHEASHFDRQEKVVRLTENSVSTLCFLKYACQVLYRKQKALRAVCTNVLIKPERKRFSN